MKLSDSNNISIKCRCDSGIRRDEVMVVENHGDNGFEVRKSTFEAFLDMHSGCDVKGISLEFGGVVHDGDVAYRNILNGRWVDEEQIL